MEDEVCEEEGCLECASISRCFERSKKKGGEEEV